MYLFRHTTVRRITLCILFSWGLLTQVAVVYACESNDGNLRMSCCCDAPRMVGEQNGECENHGEGDTDTPNPKSSSASSCCEISYAVSEATLVSSNAVSTFQVLLLDASQPPPLPSRNDQLDIIAPLGSIVFLQTFLPTSGTLTYLHTQRLRI